jgi:hypothetical protein
MKLERTVTTHTDSAVVFAYLSDFAHAEEWDSGTVSCQRISGDGGVGTTYRNVSRFGGRDIEIEYVVEENMFPRYVVCGRTPTMVGRDTITVTAMANGGCTVSYLADFEFSGIARYLAPLTRVLLNRLGNATAAQLEATLNGIS